MPDDTGKHTEQYTEEYTRVSELSAGHPLQHTTHKIGWIDNVTEEHIRKMGAVCSKAFATGKSRHQIKLCWTKVSVQI